MAIGTTANGGSLNSDGKSNTLTYDVFSRLQTGTANYAAGNYSQTYNYDPFGNVTNVSTTDPTGTYSSSISVDHQTNRVNAAGTSYDAAGNLTADSTSTSRRFDSLSIMTDKQGSSTEEFYVYTASDERIGVESRGGYWTWSFRDDTGKVLRQFQSLSFYAWADWLWTEDYAYRSGGQLLAAERVPEEGGRRHFNLDSIGTPRLETGPTGGLIARHDYLPFGVEVTSIRQELDEGYDRIEPMHFTGHERDFQTALSNSSDYLDYMHARYYESVLMRFISLDPHLGSPENPQSFNRYAYVLNNPLTFSDPTGQHDTDNMCASIFGCGDLSADNLDAWLAALGVDVQPDGPAFTVNESITVTADALPASTAADVACDAFDGMMFDVFKLSGAGDMFHGMLTGDLVEFGTGYLKAGTLVIPGGEEATGVAEGAEALRASGAVKSAIGATGEIGEAALKELGGESQAFFQTSKGARYVDQFVDGAAHESKVGYQSLTRSIKRQIEKDSELLHTEQVKSVTWHFFDSPVTGKIGPSAPLRQFLEEHGITVVFGK